jgi:hypothetical protein
MLLERLSKLSGVEVRKLRWIADTADKRYRTYEVDKRDGGKRTIEHPSRALKAIQRFLNRSCLKSLPVHDNATAYKKGASIRVNAEMHVNSDVGSPMRKLARNPCRISKFVYAPGGGRTKPAPFISHYAMATNPWHWKQARPASSWPRKRTCLTRST